MLSESRPSFKYYTPPFVGYTTQCRGIWFATVTSRDTIVFLVHPLYHPTRFLLAWLTRASGRNTKYVSRLRRLSKRGPVSHGTSFKLKPFRHSSKFPQELFTCNSCCTTHKIEYLFGNFHFASQTAVGIWQRRIQKYAPCFLSHASSTSFKSRRCCSQFIYKTRFRSLRTSVPTTDAGHSHHTHVPVTTTGDDDGNLGYTPEISAILANESIPVTSTR